VADIASGRIGTGVDAFDKVQRAKARRRRFIAALPAVIGTLPMATVAIGVFIIAIAFTIIWSFTSTKFFPSFEFVGLRQYAKLWSTPRWVASVSHIWFFGIMQISFCMVFGFLLAVFMDQRIRQEDTFRTIFLYPFALSAIITGLIWQWVMDPGLGVQAAVQRMGWTDFRFAPIANGETAIYGLVVATVWNGAGVTMAILLAGLRGIDDEIWKATRIDGIPAWRVYLFIVIPMMRGAVTTALILLTVAVVRIFDLEVAMTGGGPGIATRMPASYVIDNINSRDVAQGMAAAVCMLIPILSVILVISVWRWDSARRKASAR
jgi:glucose/mannose transport system permease protein